MREGACRQTRWLQRLACQHGHEQHTTSRSHRMGGEPPVDGPRSHSSLCWPIIAFHASRWQLYASIAPGLMALSVACMPSSAALSSVSPGEDTALFVCCRVPSAHVFRDRSPPSHLRARPPKRHTYECCAAQRFRAGGPTLAPGRISTHGLGGFVAFRRHDGAVEKRCRRCAG